MPHNTITPIARRRGAAYELDLVLRNNITTEEHPLGVFHPHAELHHIKKENIGLIEVMGLAVLPARLKGELAAVADALVSGADLRADERTAKHADWAEGFKGNYTITADNALDIVSRRPARSLPRAGARRCVQAHRRGPRRLPPLPGAGVREQSNDKKPSGTVKGFPSQCRTALFFNLYL